MEGNTLLPVVKGVNTLVEGVTPHGEHSVEHLLASVCPLEGVCSLNEVRDTTARSGSKVVKVVKGVVPLRVVRDTTPGVRRDKECEKGAREKRVSSKKETGGVMLDNRFTYGVGERPKTLEDMGIDVDLYDGAVQGCPKEELRRHIEGYWALPPEDRGRLTRPMTMHVVVTVVLNGLCWRLRCLVDGGAARNVLSDSVYEDMQRRGLKHDGTVSVPRLSDISGKEVKATEGARMNISILPRKEKCKVVLYKAAIGQHLGYDMVLGAPFLNRYWVTPLYQWMVLYIGRTRGKEGPWVMGSVDSIVKFMRDRVPSREEATPPRPGNGRGGPGKAPPKRKRGKNP